MPKCYKIYLNCIWHVPSEWHGLNFASPLLTSVYWNYATHIVRVCVSSKSATNPDLPFTKKVIFKFTKGSKAMASLYDLLCYHSLTSTDPFLEELLAYLPTCFHSHISIIFPMNTPRMTNQSTPLTLQFLHFIPMNQLIFLNVFLFLFDATPNFTRKTGTGRYKKAAGRERPTTCTCPWQVNLSPKTPRFWQRISPAPSIQLQTTPPFAGENTGSQKSLDVPAD